jgi:hypothetical protein
MGDHVKELRFKEVETNEIKTLMEIIKEKNNDLQIEN